MSNETGHMKTIKRAGSVVGKLQQDSKVNKKKINHCEEKWLEENVRNAQKRFQNVDEMCRSFYPKFLMVRDIRQEGNSQIQMEAVL